MTVTATQTAAPTKQKTKKSALDTLRKATRSVTEETTNPAPPPAPAKKRKSAPVKNAGKEKVVEPQPSPELPEEAAVPGKPAKKRRWHPGTVALREIKRYQRNTDWQIPKAPVNRLIDEILHEILQNGNYEGGTNYRIGKMAREALHEISEVKVTEHMHDMGVLAHQNKKVTIMPVHNQTLKMLGK